MSSLNRPLAGPTLSFHLAEQADALRRDEAYPRSGRAARTLVKSGRLRVTLVTLAAGVDVGTEQADSPLTLQVLHGGIRYRTPDGEHELRQGQLVYFGPGDAEDIRAGEESVLLLTLAAIGDDYRDGEPAD